MFSPCFLVFVRSDPGRNTCILVKRLYCYYNALYNCVVKMLGNLIKRDTLKISKMAVFSRRQLLGDHQLHESAS